MLSSFVPGLTGFGISGLGSTYQKSFCFRPLPRLLDTGKRQQKLKHPSGRTQQDAKELIRIRGASRAVHIAHHMAIQLGNGDKGKRVGSQSGNIVLDYLGKIGKCRRYTAKYDSQTLLEAS